MFLFILAYIHGVRVQNRLHSCQFKCVINCHEGCTQVVLADCGKVVVIDVISFMITATTVC